MIVEQFLAWFATASLDGRLRATAALARSLFVSEIEDQTRASIEATLTVLLDDPEPEIRRVIADIMAPSRDAPRHLILALADGPPDIAAIVLEQSPVLIEAELVDFLAAGTEAAQVAIASRIWLSPGLSAAVAEVGDLSAAIALARNLTASIPVASLLKLADRFGQDDDLSQAMLARAHLPIEVRHTLLAQRSVALAAASADRTWVREERAVNQASEARDKITVQMAAAAQSHELAGFVEHLRKTGQLTTALLLRAATLGDVRFVQEALTVLSGLPQRRVEGLIVEGRESACRALFEKAGLPPRVFPAFLAALDVQRDLARDVGSESAAQANDHRFAARVVERVLAKCHESSASQEDDLIVLLRRFATEAARDAARALVAGLSRRPPLLLSPPDRIEGDEDEILLDSDYVDDAMAMPPAREVYGEAVWAAGAYNEDAPIYADVPVFADTRDYADAHTVAYPVFPDLRADECRPSFGRRAA
jgi:uncharacterized protein (DUF2336 family)